MKLLRILLVLSISRATTINMPDDYSTIQEGSDAATNGDTVFVSAGTYYEKINFNGKNLAVIGGDKETTIIDGEIHIENSSPFLSNLIVTSNVEAYQPYLGCTDETACNYDAEATLDDGSCENANLGFLCNDECGDNTYMDNCNCIPFPIGGNGCVYPQFGPGNNWCINTSMAVGFFSFEEITLFGNQIVMGQPSNEHGYCPDLECDIIAANYNGIIVGWVYAYENLILSVHLNDNISSSTVGYPSSGETIYFNFFDVSENKVYNDFSSYVIQSWSMTNIEPINITGSYGDNVDCNGICYGEAELDCTGECEGEGEAYCFTHDLPAGNSLISIPGQLDNTDSQDLMQTIIDDGMDFNFLITQGFGLFNIGDSWSGNLTNVNPYSGYWINISNEYTWNLFYQNGSIQSCESYSISSGNNLLSFKWGSGSSPTLDALGGVAFATENFNYILGQGFGFFNTEDGWLGNLTNLVEGRGYWLNISTENMDFKWGFDYCANPDNTSLVKDKVVTEIPKEYQFIQSTKQAFYLIKELKVDGKYPEAEDLILAYYNEILIGSAVYNESMITLPVMGRDLSEQTEGFIEVGQVPSLRLYKSTTGEMIDLEAELEGFVNLLVSEVASVTGNTQIIPDKYALYPAYPNPFNPVTTINYELLSDTDISLNVYDIEGRKITTLTEGIRVAGIHSVDWNALGLPSGVYFIKLDTGDFTQTQKMMLVK